MRGVVNRVGRLVAVAYRPVPRLALMAAFGIAVTGGLAEDARAATVFIDDSGTLHYRASSGELNDVRMVGLDADQASPFDRVRVTETSAPLVVGDGCASVQTAVECPIPARINVDLADGDDRAALSLWPSPAQEVSASITGGTGNDSLLYDANEGDVELSGDVGDDQLSMANEGNGLAIGGDGNDSIEGINPTFDDTKWYLGGPGSDSLRAGGDGNDVLDGGPGADDLVGPDPSLSGRVVATYQDRRRPVSVTFDGVANDGQDGEGDSIGLTINEVITGSANDFIERPTNPFSGRFAVDMGRGVDTLSFAAVDEPVNIEVPATVEDLIGSRFDDVLVGDAGRNHIVGGDGDDRLEGRSGSDELDGEGGADTLDGGADGDELYMQDGIADSAICGAGQDFFTADPIDTLADDCERSRPTHPQATL